MDVAKQLARAVAAAQAHAAALDAAPSSSGAAHAGGGSSPAVLRAPKPGGPAPHVNAAGTRGDKQQRRGAAAAAAALAAEPSTDSIPCGDGVLALCYSLLKTGQPDGPLALLGESPKLMVRAWGPSAAQGRARGQVLGSRRFRRTWSAALPAPRHVELHIWCSHPW